MTLPTNIKTEQKTLILGIGNTLCGDDGAGIRAVEMLETRQLPSTVRVMNAGLPGWALPSWFENWQNVILIDALEMGENPGTWRQFQLRPLPLGLQDQDKSVKFLLQSEVISLHQPDLANGLALAEALDLLPSNLSLYGIQPSTISVGHPLSKAVHQCLPGLIARILNDLGKGIYEPKTNFTC